MPLHKAADDGLIRVGQGSGTCPSLISCFSVSESAKSVVEYLSAVVQPVANDSKVLHNASAVAVHVGKKLIRYGRPFGAGRVFYGCD